MAQPGDKKAPGRARPVPPAVAPGPPPAATPEPSAAPPVTRNDAAVWLFSALVGFLVGEIVGLVAISVLASAFGQGGQVAQLAKLQEPPEWYVGAGLVGLWVGLGGAPWVASRVRGTRNLVADFGLRFRWIDLVGLAIGVAGQYGVALLYLPFKSHIKNFGAPATRLTGASHGGGFLVIAVLTVLGAPFFEELFFRGLVFKGLVRLFAPRRPGVGPAHLAALAAAVVVDGVLFGLAHGEWVQLAGLALFGMVLAVLAYRTGRLGMSMVAHASFNLVAVLSILSSRGGVIH
jgi:hypothetical protein